MTQHVAHRRSDEIHELHAEIERLQIESNERVTKLLAQILALQELIQLLRLHYKSALNDIDELRPLLAEARAVIGNDVGPYGDELGGRIDRALEFKP